MLDPKKTVNDFAVPDSNLSMDVCSNCKIPVLTERDDKENGRKVKCTACLMKFKILGAISR